MNKFYMLAIGSVAGGFSRYFMTTFVNRLFSPAFPYGTFIVNMTGCLLIGFFAALAEKKMIGPNERILLMVSFCGAYTTFSAFMLETVDLMQRGDMTRAFLNVTLSVILGFLILKAGLFLGELVS